MRVEYVPRPGAEPVTANLDALGKAGAAALVDGAPVRPQAFYRGQPGKPGLYWMASLGRHVSYETKFERSFLIGADFDGDVTAVLPQPFRLHFERDTSPRLHVPDFLLRHTDGHLELVEVKGARARANTATGVAFALTKNACQQLGWAFTVYTAPDPARRSNLAFLAGYRGPMCTPLDVHAPALLDTVEDGPLPARQVAETLAAAADICTPVALAALWRAVWTRAVEVADLTQSLTLDTPIGVPSQVRKMVA